MNVVVHLAEHPEPTGQACLRCGEVLIDAMPYIEGKVLVVHHDTSVEPVSTPSFFPCGSHVRVEYYPDGRAKDWAVVEDEPTCEETAVATLYGHPAAALNSKLVLGKVEALSDGVRIGRVPRFEIAEGLVPGEVTGLVVVLPDQHESLMDIYDVTITKDTRRVVVDVDKMRVTAEP